MKKFYLLFSLFLLSPPTHAQWLDVPLPGVLTNFSIEQSVWVNETTVICHDAAGNFCISEDGGNSYSPQATSFWALGSLSHPSKEVGYVVDLSTQQIFKTTDTWKTSSPLVITDGVDTGFHGNKLLFCHFWDILHGVAMGDSVNGCLEIWTTQDGGTSWNQVPCNNEINLKLQSSSYFQPCFEAFGNGGYIGFTLEKRMFFKISDYGQTWIQNTVPASIDFWGHFTFKNPSEGVIVRRLYGDLSRTKIATTKDGGTTWDTSYMMAEGVGRVEYAPATANYPEIYMLVGTGSFIIRSFTEPYIKVDDQQHREVAFFDAEHGVSYFTVQSGIGARVFDPIVIRTSIFKSKIAGFDVYPNPAGKQLHVRSSSQGTLQIMDMKGIERARFQVEAGTNHLFPDLVPGNYFVVMDGRVSRILTVVD